MLLREEFGEKTIGHMDIALERSCKLMPEFLETHKARKYVAERIVQCAKTHTTTLAGLTEAGRRAVAELAAEIVASD
jgi:hypothetical protein